MRGGLLMRDAAINAEPAPAIAGASVSWTDHHARAAAPVNEDHDGVVGRRGQAVRQPDRAVIGLSELGGAADGDSVLIHPRR